LSATVASKSYVKNGIYLWRINILDVKTAEVLQAFWEIFKIIVKILCKVIGRNVGR
jgi:hypothetical protein